MKPGFDDDMFDLDQDEDDFYEEADIDEDM